MNFRKVFDSSWYNATLLSTSHIHFYSQIMSSLQFLANTLTSVNSFHGLATRRRKIKHNPLLAIIAIISRILLATVLRHRRKKPLRFNWFCRNWIQNVEE